ncbi:hypothetical protein, partial [Clostridium perfringens]
MENKPAALENYKRAFNSAVFNNRLYSTISFALDMADYDFVADMLQVALSAGDSPEDMLRLLKQ